MISMGGMMSEEGFGRKMDECQWQQFGNDLQFIILISLHQDYKSINYWDSYQLYTKSPNKSCHIKKTWKLKNVIPETEECCYFNSIPVHLCITKQP